jgi:hypothetical protein
MTVNPQPGVLVAAPFDAKMKKLLEEVVNHPQIALITFDFTSDIAVLLEEGIEVNLSRVIDCEVQKFTAPSGQILTHL